jgi:hypothetical protein
MVWKAFLEGVTDNPTPTDSLFAEVKFEDTGPPLRTIRKSYKVSAGQTLGEMKVPVLLDKQRLIDQDTLKATLTGLIGVEIT